MALKFPQGFLWGTATAAHQIEGNNTNSDWWEWEQKKEDPNRVLPKNASGIADDSYNRYEEDFDLAVGMNNNAIRFSVEWARLEPQEGVFDQNEFDHYKKMIKAAKDRGLKVFLTLHHFTNPIWFAKKGAFTRFDSPTYFAKYAKKCAEEFGDTVDAYCTINEPQVYTMQSYLLGQWYPAEKNPWHAFTVQLNLLLAHRKAFDAIKSASSNYKVGIVKHVVWYETPSPWYYFWDHAFFRLMFWLNCDMYLYPMKSKLDFIGLNYYFVGRIVNLRSLVTNEVISDMGWGLNANGIEQILLRLKKYNLPIYITENGLADSEDVHRKWFLTEILTACHNAISKGVDLKGYFHWSLLDNFEWSAGYWPRFGLIEIDRENGLKRIPRPSSEYYANVAKNNSI